MLYIFYHKALKILTQENNLCIILVKFRLRVDKAQKLKKKKKKKGLEEGWKGNEIDAGETMPSV